MHSEKVYVGTTGFLKTVPSVYTLLMNTIYLFQHSTQVAEGTVFRKHTVYLVNFYFFAQKN